MTINVLMVCLGNICRSPTAHGVLEDVVLKAALQEKITIDSAGTGDWHIGRSPDSRSCDAAKRRGYSLDHLRARQVSADDFLTFDYILAMDEANLADLRALQPANSRAVLALYLAYSGVNSPSEVPDPYYGGSKGFDKVLDLVEEASLGLLQLLREKHQL